MPVTDGLLNPIFIQEASVAYVPVTLQLADFYVPFVSHTEGQYNSSHPCLTSSARPARSLCMRLGTPNTWSK